MSVSELSVSELETCLAQARERFDKALKAWAANTLEGRQGLDAAETERLTAERALAAARGEEYAAPLDFPVCWDVGAPLPQLLVNGHRTLLLFYVRVAGPHWDDTYVTVKDPASDAVETLALVEFRHCLSAKLGAPNDEVLAGHPLSGRGLDAYTAQVVENSAWLAGLEAVNKVHPRYRAEGWRDYRHFVFWFHDETFECVAQSYTVEVVQMTMPALLAEACRRLYRMAGRHR